MKSMRLLYFSEVSKQTIFYNSRSSKEKKKCFKHFLDCQVLWEAKYKVDPPILSADQMSLHRNESGSQKSLNFSGSAQSCFVKENHHLTRERSTVLTIAIKTPPLDFEKEKELALRSIHQSKQLHNGVIKAPISP